MLFMAFGSHTKRHTFVWRFHFSKISIFLLPFHSCTFVLMFTMLTLSFALKALLYSDFFVQGVGFFGKSKQNAKWLHRYTVKMIAPLHWAVHRIPNPLSNLFWFGFCYISTGRLLHENLKTTLYKHSKTPEPKQTTQKVRFRCPARC